MTILTDINYLAVIVATVVYYVIGFFWYTVLFGEVWRKESGVPNNPPAKPAAWALAGQFISTLLFALGVAVLLKYFGTNGVAGGIFVSVVITVFFVIPINSGNLFLPAGRNYFFSMFVKGRWVHWLWELSLAFGNKHRRVLTKVGNHEQALLFILMVCGGWIVAGCG